MPSSTEAMARYMAACSHGTGYASCPPAKVSHDFNQADKGSALLSSAMKHKHAAGGSISPLASLVGDPMTMRSTSPRMGQPMGGAGRMRMPHVPLADTMHNIDQHMAGARAKLPKLKARKGGRAKRFDEGGHVTGQSSPGSPGVSGAVRDAVAALRDYVIDRPRREIQAANAAHQNAVMEGTYTGPSRPLPTTDEYAEGGDVRSSSPGSPGVSGALKDALAALRDYMVDRPRREIQAAHRAHEDAIVDDTDTAPAQQATRPDDYAGGGPVAGLSEHAKGTVKAALTHLANKDAASAAATLHASPEAMQHPIVRLAAHALRTSQGMAPAVQGLAGVAS